MNLSLACQNDSMRIGVIGCGNISGIYFDNLIGSREVEVIACSDLDIAKAQAAADHRGIKALSVEDLLGSPDIEMVLNLTVPTAHMIINMAAIQAGKHVYCEKPLALSRQEGLDLLAAANAMDLRVGCAPDTFMGGGLQLCRRILDEGTIGEPIGANAFMMCHGHESWHPSPAFYYEQGGGPLFDMGPYYLTALVSLMGPVRRVSGSAQVTFPTRTITSAPMAGQKIVVQTPTHIVGVMDFASGAIGQVTMSFDVWHHQMPHIEIYGTEGSLSLPDPNGFGGPVMVRGKSSDNWAEVPITTGRVDNGRGTGVIDMALGIRDGRPHLASGEMAFHVLDVMQSILQASDEGESVPITSYAVRPEPIVT